MSSEIKLLDHGYVRFVESWGSDERIVEAARMSTDKGFQGWGPKHTPECTRGKALAASPFNPPFNEPATYERCNCSNDVPGDEKLLKYLYDNKHMSPFEMAGLVLEVQAPIFVFREWHRHRTGSYNELSARYTPLPDVNYVPSLERLMMNAGGTNKQAGTVAGAEALTRANAERFQKHLEERYEDAQDLYEVSLNCGVPKELARIIVPVGRYSRMRAQMTLRNWLQFLTLRLDKAAQWEIRQYAEAVLTFVQATFPRVSVLFRG